MGFFSKKQKVNKVNYDELFKEQYKSINQLAMQAHNELDYVIKESLYAVIVKKYDELLDTIDQGANYDKQHFQSLKESAMKEYEILQKMNKD